MNIAKIVTFSKQSLKSYSADINGMHHGWIRKVPYGYTSEVTYDYEEMNGKLVALEGNKETTFHVSLAEAKNYIKQWA